ncbi:MAG: anthranilate phosphoribosyltransferase, partial [Planctomycetota bacterium]
GDTAANAEIVRDILSGKEKGPRKDIVLLNAAAAIIVGGLAQDFAQAIKIADSSINDGKAQGCLDKLIVISNDHT